MAKNYNDIYTAVYTKNNKMDFGNSMIRGNGIPLDITEVYNSYTAAENYVKSNPVAYEGQILAVTENNDTTVYVIAARLGVDETTIEHYLKPVGSVPDVDGKTIIINEKGQLEAVIPEYIDTNTTYTLTTKEVEEGTQLIFASSDEEIEDVIVLIPKANDDVYSIEEINDLLDEKADKATTLKGYGITDAYTRTETDTKIGEAVAAADHLKRKIIETIEYEDEVSTIVDIEKTILNSLSKDETGNYIDVDKYIYMIPIGPVEDDNKYYEYIAIDISDSDVPEYLFEKVGSWEVNLDAYVTNDTLKDYALKSEIPTDYVTTTDIKNYETAATAEGKYVAKEEGKSLIANTEIERLAKVNENAEENFINSVNEDIFTVTAENLDLKVNTNIFTVVEEGLDLTAVPQKLIGGLSKTTWSMDENGEFLATTAPATLSEILVPANFDETSRKGQSGLMTAEQAQKLSALVIGEGGIEISGKVNAENVEGLSAWITNNRDNNIPGLLSTTNQTLITNLDTAINHKETGLIAGLTAVKAKVLTNENSIKDHADRLEALEYAMIWHDIK